MEHKFDQNIIDRYTSDLAEKLLFAHFNMYDEVKGEDLKEFTDDSQINSFLLESLLGKWREEMTKLKSPYFDFENDQVQSALKTFMNSLSHHINVGRDDFAPLVETAVKRSFELVFRPYVFLKESYLNIEEPIIALKTVKSRLKYIKHNRILVESVLSKYEEKGQSEIVTDDLIDEIASVYTEKKEDLIDPEEYVEGFKKIQQADLDLMFKKQKVEIEEESTPEEVPAEEEQEIDENGDGHQEIKTEEESPIPDSEENPVRDPEEEQIVEATLAMEPEVVEQETEEESDESIPEDNEKNVDDEAEETTGELKTEEVAASTETISEPVKEEESKTLNDQLKQDDEPVSLAETFQQNKIETVKSAIGLNQRYAFVNQLFDGNQDEYESAITEVDTYVDYEDASNYLINNFAEKYNWDQKEDDVENLFNLLARKF